MQRCLPIQTGIPFEACPQCSRSVSALSIFPLCFADIDEALEAPRPVLSNNGRKRKGTDIDDSIHSQSSDEFPSLSTDFDLDEPYPMTTTVEFLAPCTLISNKRVRRASCSSVEEANKRVRRASCNSVEEAGFRTGRWTPDEIAFSDKLISLFKYGKFPVQNGFKLNEFLASMLKSKQSRLTKKMKNAKLSSNAYNVTHGYIVETDECIEFSVLEDKFFNSISDLVERADTRLHVQKEWRESFCAYAVRHKISVFSHDLLQSLEELEKRISSSRDVARMLRRQVMTGCALNLDSSKRLNGVFIDNSDVSALGRRNLDPLSSSEIEPSSMDFDDVYSVEVNLNSKVGTSLRPFQDQILSECTHLQQSPFLVKVTDYIKRYQLPFEYVELWVPAIPPHDDLVSGAKSVRLYFSGNAVCETEVPNESSGPAVPITPDLQYNLASFGKYSQMFSFATGCGIPGLIYDINAPYWESISKSDNFERTGGAEVWGMKTVAGITVTSPTVGKLVLLLFSRHERVREEKVLLNLRQEMLKYSPNPKWKLIVEIGESKPVNARADSVAIVPQSTISEKNAPIDEIISILGEQIPFNPHCPTVDGILSLRILLLRSRRTPQEEEVVNTITASFLSYLRNGRSRDDVAKLLGRDFIFLQQYYAYELNAIPSIVPGPAAESFWEYHDVTDESTSSDSNNILNIPISVDDNLLSSVIM